MPFLGTKYDEPERLDKNQDINEFKAIVMYGAKWVINNERLSDINYPIKLKNDFVIIYSLIVFTIIAHIRTRSWVELLFIDFIMTVNAWSKRCS